LSDIDDISSPSPARRIAGFVLGLAAFFAVLLTPPFTPEPEAQKVAAVTLLMAIWWISEAAPLAATALVPLVLFPILDVAGRQAAAAPYADPVIFLFLGGFILGAAMERSNLHKRAGLACVGAIGTTPRRLLGGVMIATALISMWVSNTATTAMMLPVAAAVLAFVESRGEALDPVSRRNLGAGLMLGVAYASSVGGLATLIGSPPNALLAGYMAREHGIEVGFAQWMLVATPISVVLLAAAWAILARLHPVRAALPDAAGMLAEERASLGRMSRAEWRVAAIFAATALAWITRPLFQDLAPGLSDAGIAVTAALILFLTPSGSGTGAGLVELSDLKRVPWDVLLLFGGGLSMAAAISSSGLAAYLGSLLHAAHAMPVVLMVVVLTAAMIFVTELTSNTASAATFLPIGGALALSMGADPLAFGVPLALAATCAFMLPVATPPNAIVYGSGRIALGQMMRAGLWLNLAAIIVISAAALGIAPAVFGR
jgi:solute carrier family 13 (sodium-dependent dicarboxylate transporter), member 2/3/5